MEFSKDCVPTDSSIVFDFKVSGQNVIKAANEDDFTKYNFTTSDIKSSVGSYKWQAAVTEGKYYFVLSWWTKQYTMG